MPLSYNEEVTHRHKNTLTNIEESLEMLEAIPEDTKSLVFTLMNQWQTCIDTIWQKLKM